MSITTRTILDQIEICAGGTIQVRLLKQIVSGDAVLQSQPHRTALEPGADCAAQLIALNAHLSELGFAALAAESWRKVQDHAAVAWTAEVLSAWRGAA